ncbi:MAG: peptidylprolyl isomerase [Bacilli bacterium]|nr:peptidylprolyl isomerase [Bacilli bacterium]
MDKLLRLLLLIFTAIILSGCKKQSIDEESMVRITLEDGRKIDVELYAEIAPVSVANFLKLVKEEYYDGVCFHRIIKDFMIQAGGYYLEGNQLNVKDDVERIVGEFSKNGYINDLKHEFGVISMARSTDNNSASAQFFICTGTSPHLDGSYAAFGRVVDEESLNVLKELNDVETQDIGYGFQNFPVDEVKISTIRIIKQK